MGKSILIVDDENYIRRLLHRTLEELELEGVTIHFAADGLQGLNKAREVRPDLMFLDLMMPEMDGTEVCSNVRGDPELVGTHVIILTAKGQAPDFAPDRGPHEFLTKPFDPDMVLSRAAEVLGIDLEFEI
jgi:CheY-like chemotaxis protein